MLPSKVGRATLNTLVTGMILCEKTLYLRKKKKKKGGAVLALSNS